MSKSQLAAAKMLIEEKRYDEARALLETIDHPTATKWLKQLDKVAPSAGPKKKRRMSWRAYILVAAMFACIGVYLIGSNPEAAERRNATSTARAVAALGTEDAQNSAQGQITQTAAAEMTPSATFTATTPATITNTPLPSASHTSVPPTTISNTAKLEMVFSAVSGVESVDVINVTGNIVYAEIIVAPGSNTESMANALRQATYSTLARADIEFSVILNDRKSATDYLWSNQTDRWTVTHLTVDAQDAMAAPSRAAPTRAPVIQRPGNCATAVAMGLSAAQAGQWPHLDRDNDGVACYGD